MRAKLNRLNPRLTQKRTLKARHSELIKYVVVSWAKALKWFRMKRTNGTTKMREENKELYGRIDKGKETSYSLNGVLRQRPKLDGGLSI